MPPPVAIVGIACLYPDADSPEALFENVLAGRRAFRRIPDARLPLAQYGSDDPSDPDRTYVTEAALIEGYAFDRVRFKVVGSTYRAADLTHWLALDVADRALADAGFESGDGLPRARTGVLVGNTLTGEFTRAQALRLRWPYVRALLEEELAGALPDGAERSALLERLESRFKAPFEPFGDESLAGGLSNTIAGRICNFFDLKGGGFTLDGACASSLLAVAHACSALATGELDVALAGGVDLSLDPFELVGFARAGALARGEMRVYDERSEGFWPGEGCGFAVLMRESDALAQGRRIRARIRGWGVSSDGAGGISRPEEEGQLLALRRAYDRAGFSPSTVGYFEGHGTGTVVGDRVELGALTRLLEEGGAAPPLAPIAVGSIKANIGHTKAASGIAGLIKTALALESQLVPPTPACDRPVRAVDPRRGGRLQVPARAAPWPAERELRAGVSSMGFGGINVHVALDAEPPERRVSLDAREADIARSAQDAELFLLCEDDADALLRAIGNLGQRAAALSRAELTDLAAQLARELEPARLRAAVVASRPAELADRLATLAGSIESGASASLKPERGIFLGARSAAAPAIGFLFAGQGGELPASLGAIGERFGALLGSGTERPRAMRPAGGVGAADAAFVQPAIVASSLAAMQLMQALGIEARTAVGHSLGEVSALCWAGALEPSDAVALAGVRGRLMAELAGRDGDMLSLAASPEAARTLLKDLPCVVACHNGPRRCAVSGPADAIARVRARAEEAGIPSAKLAVSHAFHSPLVAACSAPFERAIARVPMRELRRAVVSTRTGAVLPPTADLRRHLVAQLTEPVLFAEAIESAASGVELWIELGPGAMLTGLATGIVSEPAIALEVGGDSVRGALLAAGAAFALGSELKVEALFAGRVARPLALDREPRFFANPASTPGVATEAADPPDPAAAGDDADTALAVVRRRVAVRCELPPAAIRDGDRFLSDLHLTSIAVSALAAEAARELGRPPLVAPNEFADATVSELAAAIESEERALTSALPVPGVGSWLRAFSVEHVDRERPREAASPERGKGGFRWRVFGADGDPLASEVAGALRDRAGLDGVIVHLPARDGANLSRTLEAAKAALEALDAQLFVLIHHGDPAATLARTLHQEGRWLATRVVQVPEGHPRAAEWVVGEARAAAGYLECRYDESGRRTERRLRALALRSGEPGELPLRAHDVLLVSGGGKGIAAECALALAMETGCRLGVVGRSVPADDAELRGNLERFAAAGVRVAYAPADVSDLPALRRAVTALESELGRVSGLLHGAGVNEPRPLAQLCEEDFARTAAPKLDGLQNLLRVLEPRPLSCAIAFGSIIAELGLPGEADYAWANERLARRLERLARERPETVCRVIEWSLWSGVGMAERLGRVEALASRNITAMSPEQGIASLLALLGRDLPVRIVVTGRFGSPPTLCVEESELPVRRFIERVREHTPGIELIADSQLSFESDPYLEDHVYRGSALVPGVMALEAMAQVAAPLAGGDRLPRFERVAFLHPVEVAPGDKRTLRVAALAREGERIAVAIRCDTTDFQVDHVTADLCFESPGPAPGTSPLPPAPSVELDPGIELYGDLLFQRGRFARVRGYRALHARACAAEVEPRDEPFFGAFEPKALLLGDPGARDAAIHAVQACVPDRDLLPVGVERIELASTASAGDRVVRAVERRRGRDSYVYDLEILDAGGCRIERWTGLELRPVSAPGRRGVWPPGLLAPHLEGLAFTAFPGAELRAALVAGTSRDASERAAATAAGACVPLRHRPDGKPAFDDGRSVSVSHAAAHTLAVVADRAAACDLESVEVRDPDLWRDVLLERFPLAVRVARERGEPIDTAATRVFGAVECLRKAGLPRDTPLVLAGGDDPEVVRLTAAGVGVLSLAARLRSAGRPVVATLLVADR